MTRIFAHAKRSRRPGLTRIVGATLLSATLTAGVLVISEAPGSAASLLLAVTVAPTVANVPRGDTEQFTATGHYANLTTANITDSVTWSSSSPGVATVSNASGSKGLLTANGTGVATITATDSQALLSGTAAVTVLPAVLRSLNLMAPSSTLPKGETQQLTATGLFSDGTTEDLTNAVTWASSSGGVASVSSSGLLTALTTGTSTITATDPLSLILDSTSISVVPAVLQSLNLTTPSSSLPKGETQQLTATGLFSDATTENLTAALDWSTSTPSTVSVSPSGVVTALGTGVAQVTATDPSTLISGTTSFNVLSAVLQSLNIADLSSTLPKGETQQLTATGVFSDGTTSDLTDLVNWATSDSSRATVSASGLVTAVGTGPTTVTATDLLLLISGSTSIIVLPAALLAVAVTPPVANVPVGETQQLAATGLYSDGSTADLTTQVTWSSSDNSTANVSSSGLVTSVSTGAATITATDSSVLISGAAVITVLPAVLLQVKVTPSPATVPAFDSFQLTATGYYSDGSTSNVTGQVTWGSADTSVATVSATGLLAGVSPGTTTISATSASLTRPATVSMTVTGPSVTVTPSSGPKGARVKISGQGMTPGSLVSVRYKTGVATTPRVKLCSATVAADGTFSCKARIPSARLAGAKDAHTISVKNAHTKQVLATTTYTIT